MKKKELPLKPYFIFECVFIVIFTVCIFELVEYVRNEIFVSGTNSAFLAGLGMIAPMSLILGLFMTHLSKTLYKYISRVTDGLEQVANGDYNIYLDKSKSGPFSSVYDDFNHMVKELSSVQTLRDDFINNFSHEFKTPISSINGFANLLLDEKMSVEEQRQYLKIIAKESDRLANLANQTLLLSKLNAQSVISDKDFFSLDEQIKQCAILLSNQWEKKNQTLLVELDEISYYGNASLLQHVWINLLSNAIKFTPSGGTIEIKAYQENYSIHISITDSGIGMDETTQKNIFQRYYQGDTTQKIQGLGLGLSIVSKIIELSSGSIHVESTKDVGTCFTITLYQPQYMK